MWKRTALAAVTLLALVAGGTGGCDREKQTSDGTGQAPGGSGTPAPAAGDIVLKAEPNPVPKGPNPGSTKLTWGTADKSFNQVYVTSEGKPETLVVQGGPGTQTIDWIYTGATYEFKLYAGKEHQKVLATLKVTKEK